MKRSPTGVISTHGWEKKEELREKDGSWRYSWLKQIDRKQAHFNALRVNA